MLCSHFSGKALEGPGRDADNIDVKSAVYAEKQKLLEDINDLGKHQLYMLRRVFLFSFIQKFTDVEE